MNEPPRRLFTRSVIETYDLAVSIYEEVEEYKSKNPDLHPERLKAFACSVHERYQRDLEQTLKKMGLI